uniref:Uncharacterized protein n=1 Tax=Candidatus Kentrum sp. LFY TaxID=2126342 RepID=A0A450ULU9_9GAMM|nr:MAG: hypothetical protein BECKLFY1418B_GA0070995_10472 [Candidatus Kentron sp. LFY]
MRKLAITIMITFLLPITTYAGYHTGVRNIVNMGCHNVDNTCYVTISGSSIGPPSCNSTSIRWNEKYDANGKSVLALLTAAFLGGKQVSFAISDSCYQYQNNYPTFTYFFIH